MLILINNLRKSLRIKHCDKSSSFYLIFHVIQLGHINRVSKCWVNVVGLLTGCSGLHVSQSVGAELHESGCAVCAGGVVAVKPDTGVCPRLSQSSLEDY